MQRLEIGLTIRVELRGHLGSCSDFAHRQDGPVGSNPLLARRGDRRERLRRLIRVALDEPTLRGQRLGPSQEIETAGVAADGHERERCAFQQE